MGQWREGLDSQSFKGLSHICEIIPSHKPQTMHARLLKVSKSSPDAFCCSPALSPGVTIGKERTHGRLGGQHLSPSTVPSFVKQGVQSFAWPWTLSGLSPVCLPLLLPLLWHRKYVSSPHLCCLFKSEVA